MNNLDSKTSSAVFIGHFNLGEILTNGHLETIALGLQHNGANICGLVGDIGFRDKIHIYSNQGVDGLVVDYAKRLETSKCGVKAQLIAIPNFMKVIDIKQFDIACSHLSKGVRHYINSTSIDTYKHENINLYNKFHYEVMKIIMPSLIQYRIEAYNVNLPINHVKTSKILLSDHINIFSEQNLLNIAGRRMRDKYSHLDQSWHNIKGFKKSGKNIFIGTEEIKNIKGNPLCRSIMLALYQELTALKIEDIFQYYTGEHQISLETAQDLYKYVAQDNPIFGNLNFTSDYIHSPETVLLCVT